MVEEKLKIPSASVGLKNPESLLALRVWSMALLKAPNEPYVNTFIEFLLISGSWKGNNVYIDAEIQKI